MWTSKNRARYDRSKLRYPSDLTDDEWKLVEPLIPPGKTGGGKRTVIMREVVNGLFPDERNILREDQVTLTQVNCVRYRTLISLSAPFAVPAR
jgi:Cdc6-like AAA superfamily ATPase